MAIVIQLSEFKDLPDEYLVRQSQQGNNKAADEMVRRYLPLVKKVADRYFLMGADKDDLFQEALIGVYQAIKDYDNKKGIPFKAFCQMCATRSINSAIRNACRQKHQPLNNFIPVYSRQVRNFLCWHSIDPLKKYLHKEQVALWQANLKKALTNFEEKVLSSKVEGFSYKKIAQLLNKSEKSIDNAIQRIRKKAKLLRNVE